jgi:hypothetical protein
MRGRSILAAVIAAVLLFPPPISADPYNPGERALGGGLLGAGTGAVIGAIAGGGRGAGIGAAVGGGLGAVAGAATTPTPPPRSAYRRHYRHVQHHYYRYN